MLLVGAPSTLLANNEEAWEHVLEEDDITIWKKSVPGTSFVTFRGRGIVQADIYSVFAVLYDVDHKKDLMANCVDYRLLHYNSAGNVVVYNRIGSPFFLISDRDSVIETHVVFEPSQKRIVANFVKGDDKFFKPHSGAVRTKALKGMWLLQALDDGTTDLTYEASADPGGMLPSWLVNLATKKLPHRTIQAMRDQVKLTQTYAESRMAVKYLFDFKGMVPEGHAALVRTPEERAKIQAQVDELKRAQKTAKP